jgi:hypothetical protein
MKYPFQAASLMMCLLLASCQYPSLHSSVNAPFSPPSAALKMPKYAHSVDDFSDLSAEYAPFTTQALTKPYLHRKLAHWLDTNNSQALTRELAFGCLKHPTLLKSVFTTDMPLYQQTVQQPTVAAKLAIDAPFSTCVTIVGEFRVNTWTSNTQAQPATAMDQQGNFVAVWESTGQDGSGRGIYGQRFNTTGQPLGAEFRVNTWTTSDQYGPAVAMTPTGDFVVTWASGGQEGPVSRGVYGQRFNPAGEPQGNEFRINNLSNQEQRDPAMAITAAGNFVVTWTVAQGGGENVYGRVFDALGSPQSEVFRVNTSTLGHQNASSVAMDQAGNFVVAWTDDRQDGSAHGIYAQRFTHAGVPQGGEFPVNTLTTGSQMQPSIVMDTTGNFDIVWASKSNGSDIIPNPGIYGQRFDSAGIPQGSEFLINANTISPGEFLSRPAVARDGANNRVVAWASQDNQNNVRGLYTQRLNSAGMLQGEVIPIQTFTSNSMAPYPSLAMNSAGHFVVAYGSIDIHAKRFNHAGILQ